MSQDRAPRKITIRSAQALTNPAQVNDDALAVLRDQIEILSVASASGKVLKKEEAQTFEIYVKLLLAISKDEREREKLNKVGDELAKLSDDDLIKLAKTLEKPNANGNGTGS